MNKKEIQKRIDLIKKYYPNSIILRSPLSWNEGSDIDLLIIGERNKESQNPIRVYHDNVEFDLFINQCQAKGFELIRMKQIKGLNILDPELEKIIFIIKDVIHFGKFREDKYIYYNNIKSNNNIVNNIIFNFTLNRINKKNYYIFKILIKIYAEIHLFIWTRRKRKNGCSIRAKKIISKYDISSI